MYTPIKPKLKILNTSYSPFTTLASSKISTNEDFQKMENDSVSKKRFSRKRESSVESLRRFKTQQAENKALRKQKRQSQQNIEQSPIKGNYFVPKLSFKKDPILTSKYVKLDSDRSSKNHNISLSNNFANTGSMTSRHNYRNKTEQSEQDDQIVDFKLQLDMKNSEFMILQDENNRMKRQLKSKQVEIQRLSRENSNLLKQIQHIKRKHSQKISQIEHKIADRDRQIEMKSQMVLKIEKQMFKLRELNRRSQNELQSVKAHLQQVIAKKATKQTLELISYREFSLQNQLNQMKSQFQALKTSKHKLIETQLNKVKENLASANKQCQNLSIANRVLNKKNQQLDVSIQKKYKNQLSQIKEKLKLLMKQSSTLKKENLNLKKTIHLHQSKNTQPKNQHKQGDVKRLNRLLTSQGYSKKCSNYPKDLDSDDSFTISLSK